MRLGFLSSSTRQTFFLWAVDGSSNVLDYAFHFLVGRALTPASFAIVQTVNSSLLIFITAVGVFQPVVARFVASFEPSLQPGEFSGAAAALFRRIMAQALWLGMGLCALTWAGTSYLGSWLNIPGSVVRIAAVVVLLALLRPVMAGMLQGAERFGSYGILRLSQAGGRLVSGAILLGAGAGLLGAVFAFPLGFLSALAVGALMLGREVWTKGEFKGEANKFDIRSLALSALIAYFAYMSMLNTDMIWVNREFAPEIAGEYATTVLLRRVLLLVPGAAVIVMFPRVVNVVESGLLPDLAIGRTMLLVATPTLLLTAIYFQLGETALRWTFGARYLGAASYLGWMGLAVVGFSLATVWMNVFLATQPLPYVVLMGLSAVFQNVLYFLFGHSVSGVLQIFGLTGWLLVAMGALLYFFWLRPRLQRGTGRVE